MLNKNKDILINVLLNGKKYELHTFQGEYRSLMMLLNDKLYLEDFGECKGIGRCSTCCVLLLGSSESLRVKERNEASTLTKHDKLKDNIRLSCQINIDRSLNGLYLKIEN